MKLLQRLPDRTEGWAKVRKVLGAPHLEALWLAKDAERFLELLAYLTPDLAQRTMSTKTHPRIKVLFSKLGAALDHHLSTVLLPDILRREPWKGLERLDALLPALRKALTSRAQIERELLYEQRQATEMSQLRSTFNKISLAHPEAIVLRVELYRRADLTDLAFPSAAAQAAVKRHCGWLKQVKRMFAADLVHVREVRQLGGEGEAGIHVMIVVDGRPQRSVGVLQDEILSLWTASVGPGAYGHACKGPHYGIYCRGRQWPTYGDCLNAELADAALYFIYGEG